MAAIPARKAAMVRMVVEKSPDSVLERLRAALAGTSGRLAEVREMVEAERERRRAMNFAFRPLMALSNHADGSHFPTEVRDRLWAEISDLQPGLVEMLDDRRLADGAADKICGVAAGLLRDDPTSWTQVDALDLASDFDLVTRLRDLPDLLPELTGRPSDEAVTHFRLVLRDAQAMHEDGVMRVLRILSAHLAAHPAQTLRLVALSAPNAEQEAVIEGSELSALVEGLITRSEAAGEVYLSIDPASASEAEVKAADRKLHLAVEILAEVALTLQLRPGGAWATRQRTLRRRLTDRAVHDMKAALKAVEKALPLASARIARGMTRKAPDLGADPDSPAIGEAQRRLILFAGLKAAAAILGCAAEKARIGETLDLRLADYVEEAVNRLNDGEVEDRARAARLIERAADFLDRLGDGALATAARRRLAAAEQRAQEDPLGSIRVA